MGGIPEYRSFPNEGARNARQEKIEVPVMARMLALPTGGRVMEVGCGRGVALPALAARCRPEKLVGLDFDHALLSEARHRAQRLPRRCELVCADVRAMPFPDDSFDVVIDFGTLYHIARAEDAMREVARVLAPGGLFAHETKLSQLVSHPVRSHGRRLPWSAEPSLRPRRRAVLWATRVRT